MATRKGSLPRKGVTRPRQSRNLSTTGLNASPAGPSSETGAGTPRTPKRPFEDLAGEPESSGTDDMPMYRGRSNGAASPVRVSATKKRAKRVKYNDNSEGGQVEDVPIVAERGSNRTLIMIDGQAAQNDSGNRLSNITPQNGNVPVDDNVPVYGQSKKLENQEDDQNHEEDLEFWNNQQENEVSATSKSCSPGLTVSK